MGWGSGMIPQFIVIKFPWDLFGLDNTKEKKSKFSANSTNNDCAKTEEICFGTGRWGKVLTHSWCVFDTWIWKKIVEPLFTGLWVCILWECPEDTNYFMGSSPPTAKAGEQQDSSETAAGLSSYLIASPLVTVHSQCRETQGSGRGQGRVVHGVCFRVDFLSSSSRNCRNIQRGDRGFYSSWRACGKGQRSKHSGRHLVTHISPPTCVVQVGMLDPSRAVYVLVKSKLDDYVDPITSSFLFTNAENKSLLGYCYVKQLESMRLRILVKGQ